MIDTNLISCTGGFYIHVPASSSCFRFIHNAIHVCTINIQEKIENIIFLCFIFQIPNNLAWYTFRNYLLKISKLIIFFPHDKFYITVNIGVCMKTS